MTKLPLTVRGNVILRGGKPIGSIQGDHILDPMGKSLGYVEENRVHGADTKKLAWLEGKEAYTMDSKQLKLHDEHNRIEGDEISDAHRAAIHMFLGGEEKVHENINERVSERLAESKELHKKPMQK